MLAGSLAAAATPEWRQGSLLGVRGPARNELRQPAAVAVLEDDSVVALDRERGSLVWFDRRGRYLRTLGGTRRVGGVELRRPEGLAVDRDGNVWVADTGNHRLVVLAADGSPVAAYGSLGSSRERFREPRDVAFDRSGRVYVADTGNQRIQVLRVANGAVEASWGSRTGGRRGHLERPVAVAYTRRDKGGLWVLNRGAGRRLERFDLDGRWDRSLEVPAAVDGEVELADVVVDPALYRMFLADRAGGRVLVLNRRGALKRVVEADGDAWEPGGLALTRRLELFVADRAGRRVVQFSPR